MAGVFTVSVELTLSGVLVSSGGLRGVSGLGFRVQGSNSVPFPVLFPRGEHLGD